MNPEITLENFLIQVLPFISVAVFASTVIVVLNCLWRVENHMHRFLQLLLVAILVGLARLIIGVIGLDSSKDWLITGRILDMITAILLLSSFTVLLRMLKKINKEK